MLLVEEDALDGVERDAGAGRVVGIGDQHGLGARRDGVHQALERKFEVGRLKVDLANGGSRHFGVETVHRVGRPQEHHFVVVVDVGVDQDLDGFVGAVGQQDLRRFDGEVRSQRFAHAAVVRVDGHERFGDVVAQELGDARRTADGVLVEVHAQFVQASAGGRRVGRHAERRLRADAAAAARADRRGQPRPFPRRRISVERACASRPSARASVVMAGDRLRSAVLVSCCTVITLT